MTRLILISLMCAAALLSLFFFSTESLRLDESQSMVQTSHSLPVVLSIIAQDVHVPLYHVILHFWQIAFGNDVGYVRLLSLFFYLAAIPAVYALGARVFGESVGVYAAALMTLSPFMNWYGSEIRMYSLLAFVTTMSHYAFMNIYKMDDGEIRPKHFALYIAVAVMGMYTHYFFVFVLITQLLFFLLYRSDFGEKAMGRFMMSWIMIALAFAPWIAYVASVGSTVNYQPHLSAPTSVDVFNTLSHFMLGFHEDWLNSIMVSLWPLFVLFVFLALRKNNRMPPEALYFLLAIIIPVALVFVASITVKPIYVSRYLTLTIPPLYLLVSWVLSTYGSVLRGVSRVGILLLMFTMLGIQITSADTPVREDYRSAAAILEREAMPYDIILVSAPFTVYPLEYYYEGSANIRTIPYWDRNLHGPIPPFEEAEFERDISDIERQYRRVWLVLSFDQGYEEIIRLYFDSNFERTSARTLSPKLNLYSYQIRYDNEYMERPFRSDGQPERTP